MKRRLNIALTLALFSALLFVSALGETGGDPEIEALLSGMTLPEKVGQMMFASFRIWKEMPETGSDQNTTVENAEQEIPSVNITELNDEIRTCLHDYHFGGTILFAENCRDAEQVLRLVSDIQAENQIGGGLPMLVAADQEGGSVARLSFGTTGTGNMALAATGDPENTRTMAAIYGEELSLLGINTDFAPVMDVNANPNNPVIGVRSFSDSPDVVSEFGAAYVEGLQSEGVIATFKHFPGHGNTDVDSHTGLPRIDRSYDELKAMELVPFDTVTPDMIMTAHIEYPQIEKGTYISKSTGQEIYLPATMSHAILTDILRGDMGFEGVLVTDALDMAAISDNFTDEDVLRLTINAGADMLILPIVTDTNLFKRCMDAVDTAVKLVEDGEIDEARIDEAVRRILTLKKKRGLLDQKDFTVTQDRVDAAVNGVGSEANRQVAWEIAEKANTLLRNENSAFPIQMEAGETALVVFSDSSASRVAAGDLLKERLGDSGEAITIMVNNAENGDECVQAATDADHVVLVDRVYNAACLNPNTDDGFSTATFDRIIEARHAQGKRVIVVSCQLPYGAARFMDADAMLLTYGSSPTRTRPARRGEGSAYAPNLPAALCACFGMGRADGKLPVNLPALDENYAITGEIAYPFGYCAE